LSTTEMTDGIAEGLISLNVSFRPREVADQPAHVAAPRALNDRCREAHGAVPGPKPVRQQAKIHSGKPPLIGSRAHAIRRLSVAHRANGGS